MDEIDKNELPLYGVIGKINSNFELPNGNIRISLIGINRAYVYDYIEEDNYRLDGIIGPDKIDEVSPEEEKARVRLLKKEFSNYVSIIPSVSNYLITKINEENSLENITDIIVNVSPLNFEDKYNFIELTNPIDRCDYLITLLKKV